jgi:hypothetical protein
MSGTAILLAAILKCENSGWVQFLGVAIITSGVEV